ncbi:MAG: pyruvate synthase subunit beta [Chlorobiaceae bacterium]|nr:pyruvate synthase subunit beta [Chlorobiaceae bacterium]
MENRKERKITARNLDDREFFYGHKGCPGCGGSLAVRLALKVLGEKSFAVLPAGCMSAIGFVFPQMAFSCNAMISTFAGTASMLAGVAAGARALGLEGIHAVGFAGDGGTADIGLQALSGAIDRHDRIIYICYDNEAYMNTGVQKSSLTPTGARTTTSPVGNRLRGAVTPKKQMFEIVAAHGIDYAATASVGHPLDYLRKVEHASRVEGTSYIHVFAPCPVGWGHDSAETIEVAKAAVDCGLLYLAEYTGGGFILNHDPGEFSSIRDYLLGQGRFRHLGEEEIEAIVAQRDSRWQRIRREWRT